MASCMILGAIKKHSVLLSASSHTLSHSSISSFSHRYGKTLVIAEHEGGSIKAPSLSAIVAANSLGIGGDDQNASISLLLAGSGPSLHQVASHVASSQPSTSQIILIKLLLAFTYAPSG